MSEERPDTHDDQLDPGIYAVEHIPSGRQYIGATEHLERRQKQHFWGLVAGKSKYRLLQQVWKEDGPQAFRFVILEHVDSPQHLHRREQYWLKLRLAERGSHEFNSRIESSNPWGESPDEYALSPEAVDILANGCGKLQRWARYRLDELVRSGYIRRSHFRNGYPAYERKSIEDYIERWREWQKERAREAGTKQEGH